MARILELKGVRPHGVDVGHQFFSPCEMVTVGFHNHWLSGIDYIGESFQQVWSPATEPLDVMSANGGGLRGGKR
ncbi:putative [histone H3]-lysine(4) N-trimethyltransferase [Helianthus debilis subsp. tardiflorus]